MERPLADSGVGALGEQAIVHDDGRVLVVDKPAGLPATGRDLDDPDCLQHLLTRRAGRRVWAVHQLDTDTSGLIVFVTRKSLVPVWAERLSPTHAEKQYYAVCHGAPGFQEVRIDVPIAATGRRTPPYWRVAEPGDPRARPAASIVRVLDRTRHHAFLRVSLLSGRSHQVRLHLAHLGYPLVGERVYRDPPCVEHVRHALHAHAIRFRDGGTPAPFVAPLPADLRDLASRLGLRIVDA